MREILFGGKRKNGSEWIVGYFCYGAHSDFPCIQDKKTHSFVQVVPDTVGQYTGLTDLNGTRLFEGGYLFVCRFS